jgi:N-acetylneuraminate synthase/N,N'-diacetyllegionaminate synthase
MTHREIAIGKRLVGPGSSIFVVAEIGINHGGSVDAARKLIDAAAESGADAVKLQTFRADKLLIPSRDRLAQQGEGTESAFQLFRRCELSFRDHEALKVHADNCGILFFSTPFDEESVDFLDGLEVPAFKVASSDMTHLPLLRHIARKGKPILLSTGMSYLGEVAEAMAALKAEGASEILLLHCVSTYPAAPESLNLRAIEVLRNHFELPVGYSDHSQGIQFALMAAAIGATLIEKHFTLDRSAPGPDHSLSTDPSEMRALVDGLRTLELALGDGRKRPAAAEAQNRVLSRRSAVAAVDIRAHEVIAPWMVQYKRPGTGVEPRLGGRMIGMRARRNIARDTILRWEDLATAPDAQERAAAMPAELPLRRDRRA